MKKTIQRLKNERGLTLVELLAVIVILAIIAIIAFVFIGGIIDNTKKDAHIANAQQVINAAKMHEATGGSLDGEGEDTVTVEFLQEQNYLEEEILDPWTKKPYGSVALDATVKIKEEAEDSARQYTITGFSSEGCKLEGEISEQRLIEEGRKLCD